MNEILFMRCELQEIAVLKEMMAGILIITAVEAVLLLAIIYKLFNND